MLPWLSGAVLAALACLAAARYLPSAAWVLALWGALGFVALAGGLALGAVGRRVLGARWQAALALVLGTAAALARLRLSAGLQHEPGLGTHIDVANLALSGVAVSWGALALLWGPLGVADALDDRAARCRRWGPRLALAATGTTLALYSLAPLFGLLGLRVQPVVLTLGLAAMATVAYALGRLARRAAARHAEHDPHPCVRKGGDAP